MPRGVPKTGVRMTAKRIAMQNLGIVPTASAKVPMPVVESRFTINERFGFVTDMVNMLCKGEQASVVVTGPGGLGKSFTITKALKNSPLVRKCQPILTLLLKVILHQKDCIVHCMRTAIQLWYLMIVIRCCVIQSPSTC
jgi:hypothetical protein